MRIRETPYGNGKTVYDVVSVFAGHEFLMGRFYEKRYAELFLRACIAED
jgi:hypothetical protein